MHDSASASAYAYLVLSASLLVVWLILCGVRPDLRRRMLRVSLGTMLLGLTEPLFVPAYWNPPTLLDLARRTGFDLESLLFSFAIGGIVFAAYDALAGLGPADNLKAERYDPRHRHHLAAIVTAPVVFAVLLAVTKLNAIYAAALGFGASFVATRYFRPDLWIKMLVGGVLFLALYFIVFAAFNLGFPGYVTAVWNLPALSRVLVAGVPLEELMFAFTFGFYWSSVYEHVAWRRGRLVASTSRG